MFALTKKPHAQQVIGRTKSYKKPVWEKIHELNLRRTFGLVLLGLFLLLILTIVFAYFVDNHAPWIAQSDQNAKGNWYFIFSALISIYSAYFTISAYWIARKVEEYVRMPIRNYPDFIEQARKVLKEGFGEYKIMVYYPCFEINTRVQDEGGEEVDKLLMKLANDSNSPVEMLILDADGRNKFLADMITNTGVEKAETDRANGTLSLLLPRFGNKIREHRNSNPRFPIHLFWSSNVMAFVAIHNPEGYPNRDLKCSGFTSRDPDIQAAFRMIFDDYYSSLSPSRNSPAIHSPIGANPTSNGSENDSGLTTKMESSSEAVNSGATDTEAVVDADSQITAKEDVVLPEKGSAVKNAANGGTSKVNDSDLASTEVVTETTTQG
jgi:hypothetical protein